MVLACWIVSTAIAFITAVVVRLVRKRPTGQLIIVQDFTVSSGVGVAFGVVGYPTVSLVWSSIQGHPQMTLTASSGFDPVEILIGASIGAFVTVVGATDAFWTQVWASDEEPRHREPTEQIENAGRDPDDATPA